MSTRAAPGPQLSTGRLRVDAARAIAKLREYQLVDRSAWILEAIRAAVASGATAITLSGDANDVWLAWECTPWPADELPRLFDELVSPEPTEERHHLRLLAAAVNSALGLLPAFVDVYTTSPDGTLRARYTPDVLIETADIEDSALRNIAAQPAEAPAGLAYASGMLLHFRRRAALGMLTYLFWQREPPELGAARAACRNLPVPITIGETTYSRAHDRSDIARIDFEGDLDGFVAITDPSAARSQLHATIEIAERGVVLAVYPLELAHAGGNEPRGPVPVRVFIDAKRMPTNASRSQVRREVPPISTAEQRAPAVITELLKKLAADVAETDCDPRKRHAALAIVASLIAGPDWTSRSFTERLGPLAKVPLLRDATGTPRIVGHAWSGHVYTGSDPLEAELGPWVSSILWIPKGDPAAAIVAGAALDARETKSRLAWAKKQRKSHRKFFAHAPGSATLAAPHARLKMSLGAKLPGGCVPASWFENLTGEVALSFARGDGEVLLLFQGRPIERLTLQSAIGFEAVVDAVNLTPGDGYKSVTRDAYYTIVERALQAALICGAEALASGYGSHELGLAGFTETASSLFEVEARAIRAAMGMARDLQLPRSALLSKAPVWPTIDGEWVDFATLANERVIGTATSRDLQPPAGRRVIVAGHQLLAKLLPNTRVVDYDKRRGGESRDRVPGLLAQKLALEHGFALAITGDDVRGAIAPAKAVGRMHFHHLGHPLDQLDLKGTLGGCTIAVDSDDLVPDAEWRTAATTTGVHDRDYKDWEVALLRATLLTLAFERPPELVGSPITSLDNPLVHWAFRALSRVHSPQAIDPSLDEALLAKVKAAPIVHLLGERTLISIAELAKRFPTKIFFVDALSAPVHGFSPMVAPPEVAEVIARLAGIAVAPGHDELVKQRKLADRNARIEKHRRQPILKLEYPFAETTVQLLEGKGSGGPDQIDLEGFVGVGRNRLELDIRIDNRPFVTLIRSDDVPLYGVLDLDSKHADDQFTGLAEPVTNLVLDRVKMMVPALLSKIASERPAALTNPGHPRKLLYRWLSGIARFPKLREVLCAAPAFFTIQKSRTSLADAATPNDVIYTSSYNGDWLEPGAGESPTAYERGVLQVLGDDHELQTIIDNLHPGKTLDVTDEINKLQSRRRMSRGLVPIPALPHVPNDLKRKLSELGEIGARLGHGEVGLVPDSPSALIHDHGALRQRLTIDVSPAIQLAIEAPELIGIEAEPDRGLDLAGDVADQLARLRDLSSRPARAGSKTLVADAQALALRLLGDVIAAGTDLPGKIRHSIRHGVLSYRIPRELVSALDLFELLDGQWVNSDVLVAQIAKFGDAWAVTRPTWAAPLDPDRRVFKLSEVELAAARGNYKIIDAARELELDDQARRNRERTPVQSLQLVDHGGALVRVELDGDGKTGPRGTVAPLLPHAADQRGIFAHRELVPFSAMPDPCQWPTATVLDDARLEPDRTWDRPRVGATAWTEALARVTAASVRALASLVPQRDGVLAHLNLGPGVSLGTELIASKLQLRGAVWLGGAPRAPIVQLDVFDVYGHHLHSPERALGMGGTLYVHAPEGWDRAATLTDLVPRLYGHLVTQLLGRRKPTTAPSDLIAAHVATAIAIKAISPADAGSMLFPCFRPEPLDAHGLARVFAQRDPVAILPIAELEAELLEPEATGVVEDGSELSQAVIARLLVRGQRGAAKKRKPVPPPAALPVIPAPATAPKPPPKVAIHPIQNVATALEARLDALAMRFEIGIADVASPILGYTSTRLELAGSDPRLHAISNALRANSPWAPLAIDALAAHAITVLDDARSEVNQQTVRDVLSAMLIS